MVVLVINPLIFIIMKKFVLFIIIFLSAFTLNAQRNEFSFGPNAKERQELLSTINKEISITEAKIKKLQERNKILWSGLAKTESLQSKRDRALILENDEKIQSLNDYQASLRESKDRIISISVDSEGSIYSRGMNPVKVKSAAEALAMLSFLKKSENNSEKEGSLKAIIINRSYYDVVVNISLGAVWSTEFTLERRVGVTEINLPSYGSYVVTVTKGAGYGSEPTRIIKSCAPNKAFTEKGKTYQFGVNIF